jgi:biotin carboxyl carrier protein
LRIEARTTGMIQPQAATPVATAGGGVVRSILKTVGSAVRTGEPLATLEGQTFAASAAGPSAPPTAAPAEPPPEPAAVTLLRQRRAALARLRDQGFANDAALARIDGQIAELTAGAAAAPTVRAPIPAAPGPRASSTVETLFAPVSGVVTAVLARPGDGLGPGVIVLEIGSGAPPQIVAQVAGPLAARLAPGQTARVRPALAGVDQPARVIAVGPPEPALDARTVTLSTIQAAPAPYGGVAEVAIVIEDRKAALLVPRTALADGPAVFVLETGGRVRQRSVTVAAIPGDQAVIDRGLRAGDLVVLDPGGLVDGMAVRRAPGP